MKDYSQATFLDFFDFSDQLTSTKMPDHWGIVKIRISSLNK